MGGFGGGGLGGGRKGGNEGEKKMLKSPLAAAALKTKECYCPEIWCLPYAGFKKKLMICSCLTKSPQSAKALKSSHSLNCLNIL